VNGAAHIARPRADVTIRWHPLALVALAFSAWVYYPITRVFFYADDFFHLSRIASVPALTFVFEPFAGHNYVVRNLVFLGSWYLFGLHAAPWYWTVLLTHLINVWLLFGVLGTLTASAPLACLGATIWGTCPLGAGALAWYSVYGQVLAGTILLVVLDQLARLAATAAPVPLRTACLWYVLLLAGTTCFGIGIGLALVFPLVLFLLLPEAWRQRGVRLAYLALPVVTLAGYFALKRLAALLEPLPADEIYQQIFAETGLWVAPTMVAPLVGVGVSGTILGYLFDPQRYPDLRDWAAIVAFASGLALIAWRATWPRRRQALAMVVLALGVYSVIAIGRAALLIVFHASLTWGATAARYHYIATIPIVVLLCDILQEAGRIGWLSALPRRLLLAAGLGVLVASYAGSRFQIDDHPGARRYVTRTAQEIADAVAAAPNGTTVYVENGPPHREIGFQLENKFPGRAGVFLLLSPSGDLLDGRHVRFIERDPEIVKFWHERPTERLATLLVTPEEARR
jgi:hypothetical protein